MDEYKENNNFGNSDDTVNKADNVQSGTNEPSYNYKSDQIIQDSVYSQKNDYQGQRYTGQNTQQYTYQSQQPDYSHQGYSYGGYSQNGYTSHSAQTYSSTSAATVKKKERRPVTIGVVILCMLLTAIISSVASISVISFISQGNSNTSAGTTKTETKIIQSNVEMTTVEAVASTVTPSVVCIEVKMNVKNNTYSFFGNYGGSQTAQSTSYGSGVIYSTDGYIITNYHVISGIYGSNVTGSTINVYLDNDSENGIEATVVGYNSAADLAVLKIDKTGLTAIQIGDSSELVLGQTVIAIGNPGGIEFAGSVTSGIISGLDRQISVDSVTMSLIQTDAAINPGNSGGALVDSSGRLVGVPNVKISAEGYEGMGFCIPVNTVVEICNDIIENGMSSEEDSKDAYLGVEINNSFTGGAYISAVTEGGPAEAAGLKSGDIIISFDNEQITGYSDLSKAISSHKAGDSVKLGIYRNGSQGTVTVTLGSNG